MRAKEKNVCIETAKNAYYITLPNKALAVIPAVISLIVQQTWSKRKGHKHFHTRNPLGHWGRESRRRCKVPLVSLGVLVKSAVIIGICKYRVRRWYNIFFFFPEKFSAAQFIPFVSTLKKLARRKKKPLTSFIVPPTKHYTDLVF